MNNNPSEGMIGNGILYGGSIAGGLFTRLRTPPHRMRVPPNGVMAFVETALLAHKIVVEPTEPDDNNTMYYA